MLFLDQFPAIDIKIDNYKNSISNITRTFSTKNLNIDYSKIIQIYMVQDLETPESIAYKLYGDATYHWIILMLNNIINPFSEWIMTEECLQELCTRKYSTGINGIHHYLHPTTGERLDDVTVRNKEIVSPIVVTNLMFEQEENNKKRRILVINPLAVERVVMMLEESATE